MILGWSTNLSARSSANMLSTTGRQSKWNCRCKRGCCRKHGPVRRCLQEGTGTRCGCDIGRMLFHDLQERAALQDLAEQGGESIETLESFGVSVRRLTLTSRSKQRKRDSPE